MTFTVLLHLLTDYGPIALFTVVFVEQLGLPAPGAPLLVVTGALCNSGRMVLFSSILASVLACLIADACWYWIAKLYLVKQPNRFRLSGSRLGMYLQDRRLHFLRYGYLLFLAFKFLPGPNMVSLHLGYFGSRRPRLLLFDTIASLIWAGGYLAIGCVFGAELQRVLAVLSHVGMVPLLVTLVLILGMKISVAVRRGRTTRLSAAIAPRTDNVEYRRTDPEDVSGFVPAGGERTLQPMDQRTDAASRATFPGIEGSCAATRVLQTQEGKTC